MEFVSSRGTAGASELSRALNISKAGAYRIAQSLVSRDWLTQDESRNYSIGPAMHGLVASSSDAEAILDTMRPFMERVHSATEESIHLTRLEGRQVVYLDQLVSPRPVRSVIVVGGRSPAHAVSPGLVQLAYQRQSRFEWFLQRPLARYTPSTINSPRMLAAELERVRQRGYAVNVGGYREDVGGVAVAIFNGGGHVIGSLSICCPAYRLPADLIEEYGQLLVETAAQANQHASA